MSGDTADRAIVAALLEGDEAAFEALVERLHPRIVRLCRRLVPSDAVAEDVAQDTWQAVLNGLAGFEGRSSLTSWIFQIALNRARTRALRELRERPFERESEDGERRLEAEQRERFDVWGRWAEPPRSLWGAASPETLTANRELLRLVASALERLPENQRLVVVLREVEHLEAEEICEILAISEQHRRVLLHRGRARLRALLALGPHEAVAVAS